MATCKWSETEPSVEIFSVEDLDRFVAMAEAHSERPTAISVEVHGYRADLLVGHDQSFVHLTPDDSDRHPYYVTVGSGGDCNVDFWLHGWHHTEFEGRHLVPKTLGREAFRDFFQSGKLSSAVEWEEYFA
jgi:hypothetical protein